LGRVKKIFSIKNPMTIEKINLQIFWLWAIIYSLVADSGKYQITLQKIGY
jgi:hypothetical protein